MFKSVRNKDPKPEGLYPIWVEEFTAHHGHSPYEKGPETELKPMTVQQLIDALSRLDPSTPVHRKDGTPVHYTSHIMSQGNNTLFVGVF